MAKKDSPEVISGIGISLLSASKRLKEDIKKIDAINCQPDIVGNLLGSTILKAFSVELLIKGLSKQHGSSLRGHRIKKLFNSLPPEVQENVNLKYQLLIKRYKNPISLEELLEKSNDAFTNWRYLYESNPEVMHFELLDVLAESLWQEHQEDF